MLNIFFRIVKWVNQNIMKRKKGWFTYKEHTYAVSASIKSMIANGIYCELYGDDK